MKVGANSLLFGSWDMETAFKYLAMAGYDGIEMSAIDSMSQHLVLDRWQECAPEIKRLSQSLRSGIAGDGAILARSSTDGKSISGGG